LKTRRTKKKKRKRRRKRVLRMVPLQEVRLPLYLERLPHQPPLE
jgi:hypothetical protein